MIAPTTDRFRGGVPADAPKLVRKAAARSTDTTHRYILEVALRVRQGRMEEFQDLAGRILPEVNIPGLTLKAAGVCLDPDPRKVIHLWTLDSADLLRDAMIRLSDVPAYGLLDRLVVDEVQEICTELLEEKPKPKADLYVRMIGVLRTPDLAEFVAQMEAAEGLFERATKWRRAGALINITGRVNRISLLWAVPDDEIAHKYATKVPGYALIVDPETELWNGTDYDPELRKQTT